jgi:hypothetical protein
MVTPAARAVVLVPFPFSDLSQAKLRPAVALAAAGRGDGILCQITSNPHGRCPSNYAGYRELYDRCAAGCELCASGEIIYHPQSGGFEDAPQRGALCEEPPEGGSTRKAPQGATDDSAQPLKGLLWLRMAPMGPQPTLRDPPYEDVMP